MRNDDERLWRSDWLARIGRAEGLGHARVHLDCDDWDGTMKHVQQHNSEQQLDSR